MLRKILLKFSKRILFRNIIINNIQTREPSQEDPIRAKPPLKERKDGENYAKELSSILMNRSFMKNTVSGGRPSVPSNKPLPARKSRESPLLARGRAVHVYNAHSKVLRNLQTEQSPETLNRSQDLKSYYTYLNTQGRDAPAVGYKVSKKRSAEPRENRSQSKKTTQDSAMMKHLLAETKYK